MRQLAHLALVLALLGGTIILAQNGGPSSQDRTDPAPPSGSGSSSSGTASSASAPEQQLFDLLNLEREKAGLNHLQWDERLARAARKHSRLLASHRDLAHQFPNEPAIAERLAAAGARFTVAAENVATAETSQVVHMALMASPGHRANILDPRYNAAGVGVMERNGQLFVTQDFARTTRPYTEAEFREAFIAAFNRARASTGTIVIDAHADSNLHSVACSTQGSTPVLAAAGFNAAEVVTFTLSEPDKLPDQLMQYVRDARLRRMGLGVCFRPSAKYGYANFWVVAAFGE